MNDEQPDPELRETPAEIAFSSAPEFKGKPLEPWSRSRRLAAQEMGLKYGFRLALSPEDVNQRANPRFEKLRSAQQFIASGCGTDEEKETAKAVAAEFKDEPEFITDYIGMENDIGIVLWLCNQPDSVCQRVRRKPREYELKLDKWAEENIGTFPSDEYMQALTVFFELMNAVDSSSGVPSPDKKNGQTASPKN